MLGVLSSGSPPPGGDIGNQRLETIDPNSQIDPVRMDFDPLDQKLQHPGLLGGEQFVPQRIKVLESLANVGLNQPLTLVAGSPPGYACGGKGKARPR